MATVMRMLFVILYMLAIRPADAQSFGSFLSYYAPTLGSNAWPQLSVVSYTNIAGAWVHPTKPKAFPTMKLEFAEDADFATVSLKCPDGRVYKTYCDTAPSPFAGEVYSGDFNGDGVPDYLMVKPGSGCGLAAEYCTG